MNIQSNPCRVDMAFPQLFPDDFTDSTSGRVLRLPIRNWKE